MPVANAGLEEACWPLARTAPALLMPPENWLVPPKTAMPFTSASPTAVVTVLAVIFPLLVTPPETVFSPMERAVTCPAPLAVITPFWPLAMPLNIVFAGPMFTPRALVPLELIVPLLEMPPPTVLVAIERTLGIAALIVPALLTAPVTVEPEMTIEVVAWPWGFATLETVVLVILCPAVAGKGLPRRRAATEVVARSEGATPRHETNEDSVTE
jgi:hypothetical protein